MKALVGDPLFTELYNRQLMGDPQERPFFYDSLRLLTPRWSFVSHPQARASIKSWSSQVFDKLVDSCRIKHPDVGEVQH